MLNDKSKELDHYLNSIWPNMTSPKKFNLNLDSFIANREKYYESEED